MMLDTRFAKNHHTDKPESKLMAEKDLHSGNILDLLQNNYIKSILESIKIDPKSTFQLCVELKISSSTAYRMLQKLYNYGLIKRTYTINDTGKRVGMYKFREIQCQ